MVAFIRSFFHSLRIKYSFDINFKKSIYIRNSLLINPNYYISNGYEVATNRNANFVFIPYNQYFAHIPKSHGFG